MIEDVFAFVPFLFETTNNTPIITTKIYASACFKIRVVHTKHWTQGDNGQYFYFFESELEEMVGDQNWNGMTFEVIQEGSQNWTGKVIVWKAADHSAAHGRRNDGTSARGQWATGDTIKLKRCLEIPNPPKIPSF